MRTWLGGKARRPGRLVGWDVGSSAAAARESGEALSENSAKEAKRRKREKTGAGGGRSKEDSRSPLAALLVELG